MRRHDTGAVSPRRPLGRSPRAVLRAAVGRSSGSWTRGASLT